MTPYSFAVIGLRLVIVFLVLETLSSQLLWMVQFETGGKVSDWQELAWSITLVSGVMILIGVALWTVTRRSARFLVDNHEETGEAFSINAKQFLTVLLAVVGFYYFLWYFPATVMGIVRIIMLDDDVRMQMGQGGVTESVLCTIEYGLVVLLSIVLITRCHRLASWLSTLSRRKE